MELEDMVSCHYGEIHNCKNYERNTDYANCYYAMRVVFECWSCLFFFGLPRLFYAHS